MIGSPQDFTSMTAEVGLTGTRHLQELLARMNINATGATYSVVSFKNMEGFSGAPVWHFLYVTSAVNLLSPPYVRITVRNYATVDAMSGTLTYTIKSSGGIILGSGSVAVTSLAPGASVALDRPFAGGTPYQVTWRWYTGGTDSIISVT